MTTFTLRRGLALTVGTLLLLVKPSMQTRRPHIGCSRELCLATWNCGDLSYTQCELCRELDYESCARNQAATTTLPRPHLAHASQPPRQRKNRFSWFNWPSLRRRVYPHGLQQTVRRANNPRSRQKGMGTFS